MDAPKTRTIVRKKLCLKSTLDTCKYDPIDKVYYRDVVTTPRSKEVTVPPKAVDDFDGFKSPQKPPSKPKKVVKRRPRMSSMAYSYPEGCTSTQDMFAAAWNRAGAGNTDYLSENEFEIFRDKRKREALLLSKASYRDTSANSAKVDKNRVQKKEKFDDSEAKHTPLEPIIPSMSDYISESSEEKILIESLGQGLIYADNLVKSSPTPLHTSFSSPNGNATSCYKKRNTDFLRSELRNIKIEKVIIAESDLSEDEVACSQIPKPREVKISVNNFFSKNGELKSSKDLNAFEEISRATESTTNLKSKLASLSMSQNIAALDQMKEKKTNGKNGTVALSEVDKLTEETAQFEREPTLNIQNAEAHPTHRTCPTLMKRPLELSIEQYANTEGRLEKLTPAYKSSQKSSKGFCIKKSRFSYVRSLRWKTRTYKQKRVIRLI